MVGPSLYTRNGHKVLAILLSLWPVVLGHYEDEVQEVLARRLQAKDLPDGLRLKETLNNSLPLSVLPTWELFLGFSDRHKTIKGKLTLLIFYYAESLRYVSNPQLIVSVDNFGDGTRYLQGVITLLDASGREAFTTSNIYVGDFSQQQSNFNHLCYPFDDKKVRFDISVQKPGDFIFDLQLLCPEPLLAENVTVGGQTKVMKCTYPDTKSSLGFDWGSFTCEVMDNQMIQCAMTGIRQWETIFKGYILPSLVFSAMGFISFTLSVKMAMPRVATTMLALISLTNLRNAVMNLLPASGETSWLEEYFLIAMSFMLLNLCGHAVSFYLDTLGKTNLQRMINKVNLFGMISVSTLVIMARLHLRDCPLVDRAASTVVVTLASLLVICVFAAIAWFYRDCLREIRQIVQQTMLPSTTRVIPAYKEGQDDDDD